MWHSVASHAWGCSVWGVVERCFGKGDEGVVAVYSGSSAGESFEGGIGEGYSGLPEVAAVFGCSADVHLADVHSACVTSCSQTLAEWSSEMLKHVVAVRSGEEVRGSERFAVDCSVYAVGSWGVWDQWRRWYLC